MKRDRVLAVDPGREKCGVALLDRQCGVLRQAVVENAQLLSFVETVIREYGCRTIVLGDGTATAQIKKALSLLLAENIIDQIVVVDERNSTQEARRRYWLAHPPSGWRKFIPIGLLTPPCAIDDFAAIILGERYFAKNL
jgi:RNase H-fold protein (predicted Holliday junction resolvase)